jgi:hypothetical protein
MQGDTPERLQILAKMLESYIKTVELDGHVGTGTLPPAAREALDGYAAWAKTEADRVTGLPNVARGPVDDKVGGGKGL